MKITMNPIGYINSKYTLENKPPRQSVFNLDSFAEIEILKEFKDGLLGLEKGMFIVILFYFHESKGFNLQFIHHKENELIGVFATRSPNRPNSIGMSICEIEDINNNIIKIKGVDMLNNTPVLDIKPYSEKLNPKI